MSETPETDRDSAVRIDIVSDVVCPWCIVGYKQLERAVNLTGVGAEVMWHPFELNPAMVDEGEDLREHIARKYGTAPEASRTARARLADLGAELGFTFNFAEDARIYNTFQCHQLLHWARAEGRQHQLKMALFSAYFTDRQNVSDAAVLVEAAATAGLARTDAEAVLSEGRCADEVRAEEQVWTSRGIHGVPAMIFERKYLVSGAQGVETYSSILRQLQSGQAA